MKAADVRAIVKDEADKAGFSAVEVGVRGCYAHLRRNGSTEVRHAAWSYRSDEDTIRYMVRASIFAGERLDQLPTSKYFKA